jgi:uncharacterized membrane protein YesL
MTTDPARSWPLIALVAPLCAPALAAAFAGFRAHGDGTTGVVRAFLGGYRATWRRALILGAVATFALVVLAVDVRFFSDSSFGVVVIPLLATLALLVLAVCLVSLAAIAEVPTARLRDVLRASAYLGLRRWYLTLASLVVLAAYVALFASLPAIALGIAAAPALYLAWANSRHTLLPVLDVDDIEIAANS